MTTSGSWGNIGVGRITFTDQAPQTGRRWRGWPDLRDDGLGIVRRGRRTSANTEGLVGMLGRKFTLAPGPRTTVTFVLTLAFPEPEHCPAAGRALLRDEVRFGKGGGADMSPSNFERLASQHTAVARHMV